MKIPDSSLPRRCYDDAPEIVARRLIGKALIRRLGKALIGGLIVETEAYLGDADAASHSFRGLKPGNRSMFAGPGTLYVYPIHSRYCLNAVTEQSGIGSAVLIRAVEPLWAIDLMIQHRGTDNLRSLCSGPAKLCQALAVDRTEDGTDLCDRSHLWIADVGIEAERHIRRGPRIGIRQAAELPLRFYVDGNRYVSGLVRDHSRPPRETLIGP
jgi:DNA-3-methyladenine glycosylase